MTDGHGFGRRPVAQFAPLAPVSNLLPPLVGRCTESGEVLREDARGGEEGDGPRKDGEGGGEDERRGSAEEEEGEAQGERGEDERVVDEGKEGGRRER